jgi:hypothetical protein
MESRKRAIESVGPPDSAAMARIERIEARVSAARLAVGVGCEPMLSVETPEWI